MAATTFDIDRQRPLTTAVTTFLNRLRPSSWSRTLASLVVAVAFAGRIDAQSKADWTMPLPPFRIAGNLYYVGTRDLASYLIATPQGDILINSTLEATVPLVRSSVEQLGFNFRDIKILLISHAHWDHDAGSALVKQQTGASYMVMDADVPVVESGGRADFCYGNFPPALYPPTRVDRVLRDGDEVRIGDEVLVAHLTPGHTKGCTTWTMKLLDAGRVYDAVIVGGPNLNEGFNMVDNSRYPHVAEDYDQTFRVLKSLPCDLFLGAHGSYFNLLDKRLRMKPGEPNPFVDADGYREFVADRELAFQVELARQRAAAAKAASG